MTLRLPLIWKTSTNVPCSSISPGFCFQNAVHIAVRSLWGRPRERGWVHTAGLTEVCSGLLTPRLLCGLLNSSGSAVKHCVWFLGFNSSLSDYLLCTWAIWRPFSIYDFD